MAEGKNRNLQFWDVVVAVILGLMIFQWINELKNTTGDIPVWIVVAVVIGGSVVWGFFSSRWENYKFEKDQLKSMRELGYESFEEYMAENSTQDVREEWVKLGAEEKAKREKKKKSWK